MKRTAITITIVLVVLLAAWFIFASKARAMGYADGKTGLSRGGMWNYWPWSVPYRAGRAMASAEIAAAQAPKSV